MLGHVLHGRPRGDAEPRRSSIRSRNRGSRYSSIRALAGGSAVIAMTPVPVVRRRQPQCHAQFFLGVDDQFSTLELVAQMGVVALQLLDLSCRWIRLRSPLFWSERRLIGRADLLAPARDHGGVDALATQERAERTGRLAALGLGEQPPLLAPGELAASGDRNDLRVTARLLRGRLSSRPTGSFRDGLGGGTQQSIRRRLQQ